MSKTISGGFNHLKDEKSPYLQQHARNPVDWRPWSDEAFSEARKTDKPVIISIGYSSCHWCHVMEAESFEDAQTAELMNDNFICIKVDREERPDLDSLYMKAVQAMTGSGGWPLTVFATPQGEPFYGGTYFPPVESHGLPSFKQLLIGVAKLYREKKGKVATAASDLIRMLAAQGEAGEATAIDEELVADAFEASTAFYDPVYGGFGKGTKFPHAMFLMFLLKHYERTGSEAAMEMLDKTLVAMADGGIYDQAGGGFHRYSVDDKWAAAHFEKMLYDNALLIDLYSCAHVATGRQLFKDIAIDTIGWMLREMQSPQSGFYSAMDADSDGREGAYYLWDYEEFKRVLEDVEALEYISCYAVSPEGNLDGLNTLRINHDSKPLMPVDMAARIKAALFNARSVRNRPDTDKKIITAWNGLAITALAHAGRAFDRPDFVAQAERCAGFVLSSTVDSSGRLMRYYLDGRTNIKAGLEDYAVFASSLFALYEAGGKKRKWLNEASRLAEAMIEIFYNSADGRFYDTGADQEALFLRERDLFDNDVPSGNSAAAELLLQLSKTKVAGTIDYARLSKEIIRSADGIRDVPLGYGNLLCVVEDMLAAGIEP